MEGIWFYSGFMVVLSFRQRNQLRNFGSMINWVIRDESLHLKFGMNLIQNILEENAELLTKEFADEIKNIVVEGVNLEVDYNRDLFPRGILGLNADYVNQYVQYVADRRLNELGLEKHYNATNPAKWMSAATDVYELVNFFAVYCKFSALKKEFNFKLFLQELFILLYLGGFLQCKIFHVPR